jgi:alginate O-acetyltransferase complex protein AlgI
MLFNSLEYALFLPIVFFLYWIGLKNNWKKQNTLLLVASYVFYSWWDPRFLVLLMFSTLLDFYIGIKIHSTVKKNSKKIWFWLSICVNICFLGVFKYYNFFTETFVTLIESFGLHVNIWSLQIILPVGISFYTFHGLSYIIDIYKNRIEPERKIVDYALFVSYFPLLVAGPIERATHLLPQVKQKRKFNYSKAIDGLRQILWGLFKKIVIADTCAEYANIIFNNYEDYSGITLIFGAVLFSLQIYGDFSGYSDIALGTSRLFGIELLRNFNYPYFSRDIAEFWRKWHISLSSWFRDYLYIPLGGSRGDLWSKIRNTLIIFLVSGFWHGANWTFIMWGLIHALYFIPLLIQDKNRNFIGPVAEGNILPNLKEVALILKTFSLVTFAWIFFRAESITMAFNYIYLIFIELFAKESLVSGLNFLRWDVGILFPIVVISFIIIEWIGRTRIHTLNQFGFSWKRPLRLLFYYCILFSIFVYNSNNQIFIYFQF